MNIRKDSIAALIAVLAISAAPSQGIAQEPDNTSPALEVAAQTAPESMDIEEVLVTAQRRQEKSRDVPISITSLSPEQLSTANVEQLTDTARITPGLRFDAAGPAIQPSIRGVGTAITTSGGGPNVGIYVDGFFRANTYASDFQLLNVQSIQVLKGPQGTLFGRNTTGGAILVSTADPSPETSADIKVAYGRFNAKTVQAYGTTGIGENLAFDVEALYRYGDGYFTEVASGDDGIGNFENWSMRTGVKAQLGEKSSLLLRYEHSELNDPTTLMYNAFVDKRGDARFFSTVADPETSYGTTSSRGIALINRNAPPGAYVTHPGDIALNAPVEFRLLTNAVEATLKSELAFANFTSYTQYRYDSTPYGFDLDSTALPLLSIYIGVKDTTASQEIVLSSKDASASLQWTVGAQYFYYEDDWSDLDASGLIPTFGADPDTNNLTPFGGSNSTTTSLAAFFDATYAFVPERWFLTVGGRVSRDRVTDAYFETNQFTPFTGYTGPNGENVPFDGAPETRIDAPDLSDTRFVPRVVLRFKPDERSSLYASYTKGYKAGLLNVGGNSQQAVKPERNDAFELGYKIEQRRWSLETAGFLYNYSDLQVSSFQAGAAQITNAATARVYGLEGQLRYSVVPGFDINAGATWTHAKYRSFENAPFYGYCDPQAGQTSPTYCASGDGSLVQVQADASDNQLQRSPQLTGALGASYLLPTKSGAQFTFSGNLYYSSAFYFDPSEQFRQEAYSVLSFRAQWMDPTERYTVALFGDNLTDEQYLAYINANTTSIQAIWAAPITFGISLGVRFR